MSKKKFIAILTVIIVFLSNNSTVQASILKQETSSSGLVTYYVSNEEEKNLAIHLMWARMANRGRIIYTDGYSIDVNNKYDYTNYRYNYQNDVYNIHYGIGTYTGSGVTIQDSNTEAYYDFYYFDTKEQMQYVYDKIREAIKNNMANLKTDYQKAYFAYKWVLDNTQVDYTKCNYSPYPGLIGKGTVCQGYATLYAIMANELGLSCEIIFGGVDGSSSNHAWNAVKLNNKWYCLDPTWGDIANRDKYFLVTKDDFASSDYGYHVSDMYSKFEEAGEIFAKENYNISDAKSSEYVMPSVYNIEMDVLKRNKLDIGEGYTFMIQNPKNIPVTFKSDNPAVASVDNNGIITGLSAGTTTISAYNDDLKFLQKCVITVLSKKTDTQFSKTNVKLKKGNTLKLTVKNGLKNSNYKWSSSNEAIAKVSKTGVITGKTPGTCTISCTVTNGTSIILLKCKVKVTK